LEAYAHSGKRLDRRSLGITAQEGVEILGAVAEPARLSSVYSELPTLCGRPNGFRCHRRIFGSACDVEPGRPNVCGGSFDLLANYAPNTLLEGGKEALWDV
jgi:hypothetical protein